MILYDSCGAMLFGCDTFITVTLKAYRYIRGLVGNVESVRSCQFSSLALVGGAFGDDEGDVVVLLVGAKSFDLVDDGGEKCFGRLAGVALKAVDEAVFAELF